MYVCMIYAMGHGSMTTFRRFVISVTGSPIEADVLVMAQLTLMVGSRQPSLGVTPDCAHWIVALDGSKAQSGECYSC